MRTKRIHQEVRAMERRPNEGWHAIQMELAQATYCDETPPWSYDPARADRLRTHLTQILTDLTEWRPA